MFYINSERYLINCALHYCKWIEIISNVSNPNKQVLSVRHFTVQLYWEACLQSNQSYELNFMLNIPCWVRNITKIVKMCHTKRCWSPHLFPDTVITNNHALPWRLDTCIQTLQIQNFSLYVKSLGSHARILKYLFRFNIPWNSENCGMVFYKTCPGEPVSAQNFTSAFLWISARFCRTSQLFM